MIPDWVTNPSISTVVGPHISAAAIFSFGLSILLIGLGVYIVCRSMMKIKQSFPGLEVSLNRSNQAIGAQLHDGVDFIFTNKTGLTLRISYPKLKERKNKFSIPPAAARNISDSFYELKFLDKRDVYADDERTLQPNERVQTGIVVSHPMSPDFYAYRPGLFRKLLGRPKYFQLRYTVTINNKKCSAQTTF
jgi:hypothetical protein